MNNADRNDFDNGGHYFNDNHNDNENYNRDDGGHYFNDDRNGNENYNRNDSGHYFNDDRNGNENYNRDDGYNGYNVNEGNDVNEGNNVNEGNDVNEGNNINEDNEDNGVNDRVDNDDDLNDDDLNDDVNGSFDDKQCKPRRAQRTANNNIKPSQLRFYSGPWVDVLTDAKYRHRLFIHTVDPFPERTVEGLADAHRSVLDAIGEFQEEKRLPLDEGLPNLGINEVR
jgi:hypothetical protein